MSNPRPRKSLEPYLFDTIEFRPYQIEGIRWMAGVQNPLCADDMGLGKSLQALTTAIIDIKRGWAQKILVICPLGLKENWADELMKFTRIPFTILGAEYENDRLKKLTPKKRQDQITAYALDSGPRVMICNYEQLIPHLDDFRGIGFDIIISDEAHYVKNQKAKRTKAWLQLSGRRNIMLTGTPLLNHVNELWPLLHKYSPSEAGKYWGFMNRYAVYGGFENKQIVGVKNEKELREKLSKFMIRRMKSEVLTDLPPVQIIQKKVTLTDEQRRLYDKAESDLVISIDGEDNPSEIENALTKFLRLKEICGTTRKFTGKDESAKLDMAVEDALEILNNGHKLVVFTQFRDVLDCFATRLEEHGKKNPDEDYDIWELHGDVPAINRQSVVKEWGAHPKPSVLVCMLQVAGIGLNMTQSRHGFFIDKLFVPGLNQQAIDRMHRIGQGTQPVTIIEYICRSTIESRVEAILKDKRKTFKDIIETNDIKKSLLKALMERDGA